MGKHFGMTLTNEGAGLGGRKELIACPHDGRGVALSRGHKRLAVRIRIKRQQESANIRKIDGIEEREEMSMSKKGQENNPDSEGGWIGRLKSSGGRWIGGLEETRR